MIARRTMLLVGLLAAALAAALLVEPASAPPVEPPPAATDERAAESFESPRPFAPEGGVDPRFALQLTPFSQGFPPLDGIPWVLDRETTPELWDRYCSPSASALRLLGRDATTSCRFPLG
jgi:hypothetical protein